MITQSQTRTLTITLMPYPVLTITSTLTLILILVSLNPDFLSWDRNILTFLSWDRDILSGGEKLAHPLLPMPYPPEAGQPTCRPLCYRCRGLHCRSRPCIARGGRTRRPFALAHLFGIHCSGVPTQGLNTRVNQGGRGGIPSGTEVGCIGAPGGGRHVGGGGQVGGQPDMNKLNECCFRYF